MRLICFTLVLSSLLFSANKPVSKLVKVTVNICKDSIAPLVVTSNFDDNSTLISCVCSPEPVMMAQFSFVSDSISFNENDTLLTRADARRIILAMEFIHDPKSLVVGNVARKKNSFHVFCRYGDQSGYIIISKIETYQ